jgi:hypothetical protein
LFDLVGEQKAHHSKKGKKGKKKSDDRLLRAEVHNNLGNPEKKGETKDREIQSPSERGRLMKTREAVEDKSETGERNGKDKKPSESPEQSKKHLYDTR